MTTGPDYLANAIAQATTTAKDARWLVIGTVTAFATNQITATIDGASIAGIRRMTECYAAPTNGDVALFAVVRGSSSVQYIAIGKITA